MRTRKIRCTRGHEEEEEEAQEEEEEKKKMRRKFRRSARRMRFLKIASKINIPSV